MHIYFKLFLFLVIVLILTNAHWLLMSTTTSSSFGFTPQRETIFHAIPNKNLCAFCYFLGGDLC